LTSVEYTVLSTANTYGWMSATAAYRISWRFCALISTVSNVHLIDDPLFPSNISNKRYANIFTVSRTARLPYELSY
jgi:hypothetical protein